MPNFESPEWHVKFENKVNVEKFSRVLLLTAHYFLKSLWLQSVQCLLLLTEVIILLLNIILSTSLACVFCSFQINLWLWIRWLGNGVNHKLFFDD